METAIRKILEKESLSREEAFRVMDLLTREDCSPDLAAQFLLGLKNKSETVEEIVGFVQCLRSKALSIDVKNVPPHAVDVCGTGGGTGSTFNVSTTVAFVVAALGCPVAKHGNRAISSRSGSFDVLEALGVKSLKEPLQSLEKFNLGFFFAPDFYFALKHVGPIRKKLGVHTVFNLLGPLLNPVRVRRQLIGVYDKDLIVKVAEALRELGSTHVMVVHGSDGVDEFSGSAPSTVAYLENGNISQFSFSPEKCGLKSSPLETVAGSDAKGNAQIIFEVLRGESGPRRNLVLLNAAAVFMVAGKASDMKEGVALATEAIDSGRALQLLERMREGVA